MKTAYLKYILTLGLVPLVMGCQKDDLCPESTETTPGLLVQLFDAQDPTRLKAAQDLVVIAEGMEDTLFGPSNTNSFEIPLRTDQNATTYHFIVNAGEEDENSDAVSFSYSPVQEYLNRACGFTVHFENLQVNPHMDDQENNWITSHSIQELEENEDTEDTDDDTEIFISFTH